MAQTITTCPRCRCCVWCGGSDGRHFSNCRRPTEKRRQALALGVPARLAQAQERTEAVYQAIVVLTPTSRLDGFNGPSERKIAKHLRRHGVEISQPGVHLAILRLLSQHRIRKWFGRHGGIEVEHDISLRC